MGSVLIYLGPFGEGIQPPASRPVQPSVHSREWSMPAPHQPRPAPRGASPLPWCGRGLVRCCTWNSWKPRGMRAPNAIPCIPSVFTDFGVCAKLAKGTHALLGLSAGRQTGMGQEITEGAPREGHVRSVPATSMWKLHLDTSENTFGNWNLEK